jgi:hypothetical protein
MTVIGTFNVFTTHGCDKIIQKYMCGQMHENCADDVFHMQTNDKNATNHTQPLKKTKGLSHAHETKPVGAAVLMSWAKQLLR